MKKLFLMLSMAALLLSACTDPKVKAKTQLEDLYTDVSTNGDNYEAEDWIKFLDQYHQTDSLLRLYDYTEDESKEIGKLKGKCAAYLVKAKAAAARSRIRAAAEEMKGMVEGFVEGIEDN